MDGSFVINCISVSTGFAGIIASTIVSLYTIKHNDDVFKKKKSIRDMISALSNFHELEEEYIAKLIESRKKNGDDTGVSHDGIVKEMRKALRERDVDFDCSPSDIRYYKKIFSTIIDNDS